MSDETYIRAAIIEAAARAHLAAALDMLYADNHSWSERPCATCRAITGLLGKTFGCYRYAEEREARRASTRTDR